MPEKNPPRLDDQQVKQFVTEESPSTDAQQAEICTLENILQQPLPAASYSDDEACQRMVRLVEQIGATSPTTEDNTSDADPLPNQRIGHYELLAKLGEGGMGAVCKARHTKLDKIVAIKILPPERMKDAGAVARFEREMRAVGKLEHANIVRATDVGEFDGTHFLVMDLVRGTDLSKLVRHHGPLPIADACELIRQAAVGLQHVHQRQLVHRDIKPSNLMLGEDGTVKILDLGLALLSEAHTPDAQGLTGTGQLMGTFDYMAPEQGGDSHEVDIRADIYALGASLYRLLTGKAIHHGPHYQTPVQKLMALATEPAPSVQDRREGIPDALATVVHQMLEKDPQQRMATPSEVIDALAPFCEGASLTAYVAPVVSPETEPVPSVPDLSSPSSSTASFLADALELDTSPGISGRSVGETATALSPSVHDAPPRWRRPAAIAAALGGLALVAALIFYVQTGKGTLKIVIHDPSIDVVITSTGAVIKGNDKEGEIRLTPGEHQIKIQRGEFEFFTDKFELKRGETTVVEIVLVEGKVIVTQDGQSLALADSAKRRAETAPANSPAAMLASDEWAWTERAELPGEFNGQSSIENPCLSSDGLTLMFNAAGGDGVGKQDLWMATRKTVDEPFGPARNIGATINTPENDTDPCLAADGLTLYFASDREGGQGGGDLWISRRPVKDQPFGKPENLGADLNSPAVDTAPCLSQDGTLLLFSSDREGTYGGLDLFSATRQSRDDAFGKVKNLGIKINTPKQETSPSMTGDALAVVFESDRAGGRGRTNRWLLTRGAVNQAFADPIPLGWTANSRDVTKERSARRMARRCLLPPR